MTFEEFYEKYPPSRELVLDCLYETLVLRNDGQICEVQDLVIKAMREEYEVYTWRR